MLLSNIPSESTTSMVDGTHSRAFNGPQDVVLPAPADGERAGPSGVPLGRVSAPSWTPPVNNNPGNEWAGRETGPEYNPLHALAQAPTRHPEPEDMDDISLSSPDPVPSPSYSPHPPANPDIKPPTLPNSSVPPGSYNLTKDVTVTRMVDDSKNKRPVAPLRLNLESVNGPALPNGMNHLPQAPPTSGPPVGAVLPTAGIPLPSSNPPPNAYAAHSQLYTCRAVLEYGDDQNRNTTLVMARKDPANTTPAPQHLVAPPAPMSSPLPANIEHKDPLRSAIEAVSSPLPLAELRALLQGSGAGTGRTMDVDPSMTASPSSTEASYSGSPTDEFRNANSFPVPGPGLPHFQTTPAMQPPAGAQAVNTPAAGPSGLPCNRPSQPGNRPRVYERKPEYLQGQASGNPRQELRGRLQQPGGGPMRPANRRRQVAILVGSGRYLIDDSNSQHVINDIYNKCMVSVKFY